MASFYSASKNENGKAVTTNLFSVSEDLYNNEDLDPVKLSKIFTALKTQGTEAVLTIDGSDVLFVSNRASGKTLKAKTFVSKMPTTGNAKEFKVTNIRLVKTITGV
jgi:hypothetical protein